MQARPTQSVLVPPYHLDVEFRSAYCSRPKDLLHLPGNIQICRFRRIFWRRSLRSRRCPRQRRFVPERERITLCEERQDLPAGALIGARTNHFKVFSKPDQLAPSFIRPPCGHSLISGAKLPEEG